MRAFWAICIKVIIVEFAEYTYTYNQCQLRLNYEYIILKLTYLSDYSMFNRGLIHGCLWL